MTGTVRSVAIVLGGIVPHGELLRQLKQRGYYTILVDYFDNPPAAEFADEHVHDSAMDYEAVLKLAKERRAQLVMSPCLDQQMVIAMRVAEQLDLPHPFSSETALKVTNKKYMKKTMMEHGIPTARYYHVDSDTILGQLDLEYPVMVKPTDCCGSAGIRKIKSAEELEAAVENAFSWSWTKEAIVEEFKQGMEVSAYCYVQKGKTQVIDTVIRISVIEKETVNCYGVIGPLSLSDKARENVENIANQIAEVFHLQNTPMFYQAVLQGDDVSVIEFSPRIGGGLSYQLMRQNTGIDMIDASIRSYLGEEPVINPHPNGFYYLIHYLNGRDGIYDHIEGRQEIIRDQVIDEVYPLKTKGMSISNEKSSSSRTAMLMLHGENAYECLEKLKKAWEQLEIRDPDGNPLMDKSLYLTKEILEENANAASQI